jgi:hypothetical protein
MPFLPCVYSAFIEGALLFGEADYPNRRLGHFWFTSFTDNAIVFLNCREQAIALVEQS